MNVLLSESPLIILSENNIEQLRPYLLKKMNILRKPHYFVIFEGKTSRRKRLMEKLFHRRKTRVFYLLEPGDLNTGKSLQIPLKAVLQILGYLWFCRVKSVPQTYRSVQLISNICIIWKPSEQKQCVLQHLCELLQHLYS
ncbi:hypothetical protein JTE90_010461 [Oedothorax gibbosus]|uniref:Maturase K n=1 Tax=Oedothorax gibbosus TaxID=931172 RepID=A0AAV6W014_9ARAC|nr:hypothetical protein JTE90_010461 [Oedothorax gibbosus]